MSARANAVVEALWPHLDLDSRDLEPGFAPAVANEALAAADKVMFSAEARAMARIRLESVFHTDENVGEYSYSAVYGTPDEIIAEVISVLRNHGS